jgi:CRP-like cAMP-binding protein
LAERTDLEMYFVECIEEVRKQVFRRRLKTEVTVKKPYGANDIPESLEFEETLMKLA